MLSKISMLRLLFNQTSRSCRSYSKGLPENLRRNYERFQKDDGLPVHLKGGIKDRILLGVTVVLIAIGLVDGARTIIALDHK